MFVEIGQARDCADDIRRLVHNDDRCGTKARAYLLAAVKIHGYVHHHGSGYQGHRRPTRDDGEQIIPTTTDTPAMLFDQLAERNAHFFFDDAWLFHMARNLEQLGAMVVFAAKAFEPRRAATQDCWNNSNALDIVHRRWAAIKTCACREWRFQAGLPLFAFKAFDHRGFFAADIGACAAMDEHVKVIA